MDGIDASSLLVNCGCHLNGVVKVVEADVVATCIVSGGESRSRWERGQSDVQVQIIPIVVAEEFPSHFEVVLIVTIVLIRAWNGDGSVFERRGEGSGQRKETSRFASGV